MHDAREAAWKSFVRAAVGLSVVLGFGLGGMLYGIIAVDRGADTAWVAATRAHGHVQLYGWAGLVVLGVAFHFLPRLAGGNEVDRRLSSTVLILIITGITLRAVTSVALADDPTGTSSKSLRALLAVSVTAEFIGASIGVAALGAAVRIRTAMRKSSTASIAPLAVMACVSLISSLALDLAGVVELARSNDALVTTRTADAALFIAQYGFLLPITLAMSARLFPLYLRTRIASRCELQVVAAAVGSGVLATGLGISFEIRGLESTGRLMLTVGVLVAIVSLGLLGARRALPRRTQRLSSEPKQWFAVSAYGWLVVAMFLSSFDALDQLGLNAPTLSTTVQRHSFGAGFITIMILGVGQVLLPGFAGTTSRSPSMLWVTLALSNLAVLLRVLPAAGWNVGGHAQSVMSFSGVIGALALLCFAWNIGLLDRERRGSASLA